MMVIGIRSDLRGSEHSWGRAPGIRCLSKADVDLITSYEEKPRLPMGHLAVPPFYFYWLEDVKRIPEALD